MTTVAAQVPIIRRILNDDPLKIHLNGAIASTSEETITVDSTDIGHVKVGQVWEHDTGELRLVISVDIDNSAFEAYRGHKNTTATTHSDDTFLRLAPRWEYATIEQAINTCLETDLFPDVYEIQKHEYTSNPPENGTEYEASATGCEFILDIYQRPSGETAINRSGIRYTVWPQEVDTDLFTNGLMFDIQGGKQDGTEKFYVNCAHRLTISTLLTRQERMLQYCAIKYLLEWKGPRRLEGPTNQGDRSVRPTDPTATAQYWEQKFIKAKRDEEEWLRKRVPPRKLPVHSGQPIYFCAG